MSKTQLIIVGSFLAIIIVVVLMLTGVIPGLKPTGPISVNRTELNFWGLKEDEAAWADVIAKFASRNASVAIKYRGIEEAEYETTLLDNLAAGTGPDIFMIHNDWLLKHKNKLLPAPQTLVTPQRVSEIFPKVVGEDFVLDNQVFAMPISVNTMALLYNRDFFDSKLVVDPPSDWDGVKALIPKLVEKKGTIIKEAISLGGTSKSVKNAPDILTLLMLQKDVQMIDREGKRAIFSGSGGAESLAFYMGFSNPQSPEYTHDENFKNSIQAFANGETAMILAYPRDIKAVKALNPVLNFKVEPLPQFDTAKPVNLANYWGAAVSNRTRDYSASWDFINFATTDPVTTRNYASLTGSSTALRNAITEYASHPSLKVFTPQILSAKSWPRTEGQKIREIFNDMIESSLKDRSNFSAILRTAEDKVTALINK